MSPLPPGASLADFIHEKQAEGKRVWVTSRSAVITHQRCPRRRWKGYHERGLGITKIKLSPPLATGIWTHYGLPVLLRGGTACEAAGVACENYWMEIAARGLDLEPTEDHKQTAREQVALIEAFIHLAARRAVPQLLQEYEILDVEREEWFVLYEDQRMVLVMEARCDGLLRERVRPIGGVFAQQAQPFVQAMNATVEPAGDLYVLSWKTLASWDRRTRKEAKTDMQGLSEAYAVELRVGEPVLGAKMVHFLKGKRKEYPEDSGRYIQSSPLVHAWMNASSPTPEFAWTFYWQEENDLDDRGRPRKRRLGTHWKHCFIPDKLPIADWIQMLDEGMVQPDIGRDALEAQYVSPMPEPRSPEQKQRWLRQVETQELAICGALESFEAEEIFNSDRVEELLDCYFPQYTHSCNYPTECSFWHLCHTSEDVANPESLYQIRQPHHPGETLLSGEDL